MRKMTIPKRLMELSSIVSMMVLLFQGGCAGPDSNLGMIGGADVNNEIFDFLSLNDLVSMRLTDHEHRNSIEQYAHIQEIARIYDTGASFADTETSFFDVPKSPAVRAIAECNNAVLKARFINEFLATYPRPALLKRWFKGAPSNLFTHASLAETGFFDSPISPAVRILSVCGNDTTKNIFVDKFWESRPAPDVLIDWLRNAPKHLFVNTSRNFRTMVVRDLDTWLQLEEARHLDHESTLAILEALLAIRASHRPGELGPAPIIALTRIERCLCAFYQSVAIVADRTWATRAEDLARDLGCWGEHLPLCMHLHMLATMGAEELNRVRGQFNLPIPRSEEEASSMVDIAIFYMGASRLGLLPRRFHEH